MSKLDGLVYLKKSKRNQRDCIINLQSYGGSSISSTWAYLTHHFDKVLVPSPKHRHTGLYLPFSHVLVLQVSEISLPFITDNLTVGLITKQSIYGMSSYTYLAARETTNRNNHFVSVVWRVSFWMLFLSVFCLWMEVFCKNLEVFFFCLYWILTLAQLPADIIFSGEFFLPKIIWTCSLRRPFNFFFL